MDELEIITTSDGSHTLRNKHLNETYHSIHGAVQESMHVFIVNGLEHFRSAAAVNTVSILEVGFGTGLNALLTMQFAQSNQLAVRYETLEPFPLSRDLWSKLNYGDADRRQFEAIHLAPWEEDAVVAKGFTLHKRKISLGEAELSSSVDVIFFDAFAPSVQPELWQYDALKKVVGKLNDGGVFVTYSARGQMKRDLKALGLTVETLPGPPGKAEMVRAIAK